MKRKRPQYEDDERTGKTKVACKSPDTLLNLCITFVAEHLDYVDSFHGLPEIIGKQIFKKAESLDKFDVDTQGSLNALRLFTTVYEDSVLSSLNISYQYLGINYCQDHIDLFRSLREIDLTGCRLGNDHHMFCAIDSGQFECLEILCLRNNCLSDIAIQRFTAPYRMFQRGPVGLKKLDISENQEITSNCLKYLKYFKKLTDVDVTCTQVKGNPDLFKVWKFKPVKDDTITKIKNFGWAENIIDRWMKAATDKIADNTIQVKRELTSTQSFYTKKKKESIHAVKNGAKTFNEIKHVEGYRLYLVREETPDVHSVETKELRKHVAKSSEPLATSKIELMDNFTNACGSDLIELYGNCTVDKKVEENKFTLKSALESGAL